MACHQFGVGSGVGRKVGLGVGDGVTHQTLHSLNLVLGTLMHAPGAFPEPAVETSRLPICSPDTCRPSTPYMHSALHSSHVQVLAGQFGTGVTVGSGFGVGMPGAPLISALILLHIAWQLSRTSTAEHC